MEETPLADAVKGATERLRDRAAELGEQTTRVVRENAPRARQAVGEGYDEAAGAIRSLAGNRSAQAWILAGALGIAVGMLLIRRR